MSKYTISLPCDINLNDGENIGNHSLLASRCNISLKNFTFIYHTADSHGNIIALNYYVKTTKENLNWLLLHGATLRHTHV